MTTEIPWALFVAVVFEYKVRRIVANPVIVTDGGIRNPRFDSGEKGSEFANFEISAYLSKDCPRAWGWGIHFATSQVDLQRAQSYVRVLHRVQRSIDHVDHTVGFSAEFEGYLARVALALGIERYVVAGDGGIAFLNGSGLIFHDYNGICQWIACQERVCATQG